MKKVTRIIGAVCMVGLLAFVSTSCKKNQENGEVTINVSIPGIETEGDRAYITVYGNFMWHEQDFIRVYNLAASDEALDSKTAVYTKVGNQSTEYARFRGPSLGAPLAQELRIFYPTCMVKGEADEIEQTLWNENRQIFKVSDHQQFHSYEAADHHFSMVDPDAMPMAERMAKITNDATLHHMFGVASFNLNAAVGTTLVVDSVKLKVNGFNVTGEVSVKLDKVAVDNSQGAEHNLNYVWDQFFSNYKAFSPEYIQNVLAPELEYLGWMPVEGTLGNEITLNCIYKHPENGQDAGLTLGEYPNGSFFNFMLRPLALCQGFELTVYVHDGQPIVLTQDDFEYGEFPCDYVWGVKAGKRKVYTKQWPVN